MGQRSTGLPEPPALIRIGTRGSPLALRQSTWVAERLRALGHGALLTPIQTMGDRLPESSLATLGGTGAFTKEIQRALLDKTVDVGVHSLKDLPTISVPGLVLAAVPSRLPTGDVLISNRYEHFDELPAGARIGTSSIRRRAQILLRRPELRIDELRGNVETRLDRLKQGKCDAIVLARAGLERLELGHVVTEDLDWMLPAVGQGALGLECRLEDVGTTGSLAALEDKASRVCVLAERAFLAALGGGCLVPIGALAAIEGDRLVLTGGVYSADGKHAVSGSRTGTREAGEVLGRELAGELVQRGARELLASYVEPEVSIE